MPAIMPPPRLVSLPREQYLRREETRIRSLALPQNSSDPAVAVHLNAVLMCDDLADVHECAEIRQRALGAEAVAQTHHRFAAAAHQLRFHHLDQLAHLLI